MTELTKEQEETIKKLNDKVETIASQLIGMRRADILAILQVVINRIDNLSKFE